MEVSFFSKILRFLSHLLERIRAQGVSHLPSFLFRRLRVELTERRYGIHTRGWIGASSITSDPNCLDYDPIDYETIEVAFKTLDLETRKQVLLDYGCGKGRVLAVASRFPFERVVGIELSKYLSEVAQNNLDSMRLRKRCTSVQIITGDARTYNVPSDVTVLFLFNPFVGEILDAVVQRVEASLADASREMTIFHIHFKKNPSPFAARQTFRKSGELPLIFREPMVLEVFKSF